MSVLEEEIRRRLFGLQDLKYKEFACKLMPTVSPETVIGVRTPELRKLAREFSKRPEVSEFLKILPHGYYEENNLHGFLIETLRDYDAAVAAVDEFLPYIDNWATCDLISPKIFKKHLPELYQKIKVWLISGRTYTVRFGIGMLMSFYLDDAFRPEMIELVAGIRSEEYYVNMMIAWYFATALAKQYEEALPYIQEQRLEKWTHNKAIQKAVESYRIGDEAKAYLRTLKEK
jgi:3-methyladenine DNA glycosylase AlkD